MLTGFSSVEGKRNEAAWGAFQSECPGTVERKTHSLCKNLKGIGGSIDARLLTRMLTRIGRIFAGSVNRKSRSRSRI